MHCTMAANYELLGSLCDMLRRQAAITPSNWVLMASDDCDRPLYTLSELNTITDRLAMHFVQCFGCDKGSCVAIFMEKCSDYVIAYIAALKAGAAYLPLDISYPKPLLEAVLSEARPVVVCTKPSFVNRLEATSLQVPTFVFDEEWPNCLPIVDGNTSLPIVTQDDLAYIVYSSGTTGKPKGIMCPHRGAVLSYNYRFTQFPYSETDVVACNVFFVWELLRPILKGVRMVVIPDDVIFDPAELCKFVEKHKVTRMLFTPSLLETILDTQPAEMVQKQLRSFRLIWLCGEVVTLALLSRLVRTLSWVRVMNLYSVSECHDVAACDLSKWFKTADKEQLQTQKYTPVGRLIPGVKVAIMDRDNSLNRMPVGMPGEIYVGGPTLARGYLNRPEINRMRFIETPTNHKAEFGDRLYRTGDWGYLLADGRLEICGRCDTLVKIRGYSIEIQKTALIIAIQAVESTLLQLSYVLSCAVVSIGAEGEDKQLAAYVVLKENKTRKDLRADLKRRLPFYMVPSFFVFLERLPVLPASSKVDKCALPAVDMARDVVGASALAQTPTEHRLANVWSAVLGLSSIDIQESFFDLGGHSLLAARLLHKITDEFGVTLSVRDLFANPTVCSFAKLLEGDDDSARGKSPVDVINLKQEVDLHDLKDNVMDLYLRAFWRSTVWENRFLRASVLLTGSTGYVGSFILRDLLAQSKVSVICLVREASGGTAPADRLRSTMHKHQLMDDWMEEQLTERVTVIGGDVALVHFGLKDDDYHMLSYEVDVVIHAAAYVNLIYPYQALHGVNVLGTHNVLDFCHKNKVKPLHYVSTDAVIPVGLKNVSESDSLDDVWQQLEGGYAQSKWVAEQLVIRSQRRGLPIIIYRLGNQAGSSDTSIWNMQDFTYLLLYGCAAIHAAPSLHWQMEMTPVDFTAKFIVTLATQCFCPNVGKTYHLMQTERTDYSKVIQWMRSDGYTLQDIPYAEWTNRITKSSVQSEALGLLARLMDVMVSSDAFFADQTTYVRQNTDALLAELGWIYPVIGERLVSRWLKALVKRSHFPAPSAYKTGKVCMVTGASEGIGEAIAYTLAVDGGATVIAAARRTNRLEALCERVRSANGEAVAVACDITDRASTERLMAAAIQYGRVDVLVNCAGVMYYTLMSNVDAQQWRQQIDVNCHGTMNCIAAVLPDMISNKSGHIINITSDAGKKAFPGLAVYSGTKFFLEGMASALRQEMVQYNVRVTNVQPGDVATGLAAKSTDNEARKMYDGTLGDARVLDAGDVAKAVLYALSQPPHVAVNEILIEPTSAPT